MQIVLEQSRGREFIPSDTENAEKWIEKKF